MANTKLKRRSFLIDEQTLARAKRVLGVKTDGEAIRTSIHHIAEMERFWRLMNASKGRLARGSFRTP
jgi:hypothetical protein